MLCLKSQQNPKLLIHFNNESFPNISVITATSTYNLDIAYLVIDSEFFNHLPVDTIQVDLSHLPEKQLVQVLRALYGDVLVVYSIAELGLMYQVIRELQIEEFRVAVERGILGSKQLMQNLEVLQFCVKNQLLVQQIKAIHIENNLRALQSNKNFLQLNKISLETLIPLLTSYYWQKPTQTTVINNIMQNYFNRNNIKPVEFFQHHDEEVLLAIWEEFHHFLHIQKKVVLGVVATPQKEEPGGPGFGAGFGANLGHGHAEGGGKDRDARILELQAIIQEQNRVKEKLSRELCSLKAEVGKVYSTKRIPYNHPTGLDEEQEISIIETPPIISSKRQLLPTKITRAETICQGNGNSRINRVVKGVSLNY